MMEGFTNKEIMDHTQGLVASIDQCPCPVVMVTNEVGWGIVPEYPLGRGFRDLAGEINQILADISDTVVLMVAGIPLNLKG